MVVSFKTKIGPTTEVSSENPMVELEIA